MAEISLMCVIRVDDVWAYMGRVIPKCHFGGICQYVGLF